MKQITISKLKLERIRYPVKEEQVNDNSPSLRLGSGRVGVGVGREEHLNLKLLVLEMSFPIFLRIFQRIFEDIPQNV